MLRSPTRGTRGVHGKRPVLYQLCRAGERFEVGDGPLDLSATTDFVVGRGEPSRVELDAGKVFVDDPWMSSKHAKVSIDPDQKRLGLGRFFIEDLGSTNGVLVNGAPTSRAPLLHGDLIETGRTFWIYLEEPADLPLPTEPVEFGTLTTWSPLLAAQVRELERKARAPDHVLVSGPEGSGKGFVARTLHLASARPGRLVHLDCRERKPQRLAVDLFGADGQPARLREADVGTLFLENVEALPLDLQDRLLDALRRRGYVPEGKTRLVGFDVRVVASTTGEPEEAVVRGQLRQGFVEAVAQVHVRLPGLPGRLADLGLLLDDFLARARGAPAIGRDACRAVLRHPWRQHTKGLARVIEAAAVLAARPDPDGARGGTIELVHLPVEVVGADTLRQLLPGGPPVGKDVARPPSFQAGPFNPRGTLDDPETTSEIALPGSITGGDAGPVSSPSGGFLRAFRDAEEVGEVFALDATDPSLKQQPAFPPPPVDGDASSLPRRPPSAYHEVQPVERSYASVVDPDLIVDALRRARGNVSAAARYLGKPRATILRWMREFQIHADTYREG